MRSRTARGFTLIELLVVITIIGILMSLLLPAVQQIRETARRLQCANNFKQVGLALLNYETTHQRLPPGMINWDGRWGPSCGPRPSQPSMYDGWGWATHILPNLEQGALYDSIDFNGWYYTNGQNFTAGGTPIDIYLCPSDPQAGERVVVTFRGFNGPTEEDDMAYVSMAGVSDSENWNCEGNIGAVQWKLVDGAFGERQGATIASFRDGASNTLLVGEVTGEGSGSRQGHFWCTWNLLDTADGINGPATAVGGEWPQFPYNAMRWTGFASWHPGGCNFVMVDGSVHFFSENIDPLTLRALTTRAGRDIPPNSPF